MDEDNSITVRCLSMSQMSKLCYRDLEQKICLAEGRCFMFNLEHPRLSIDIHVQNGCRGMLKGISWEQK